MAFFFFFFCCCCCEHMACASYMASLTSRRVRILSLILLLPSLLTLLDISLVAPPPPPDFLASFFLQAFSYALRLHQQCLGLLDSPCPVFILSNLIVFTLLFKSFYPSSSSHSLDSDSDYADTPGDFFVVLYHQQQLCSPEDYHVLHFTSHPMQERISNWKQLEGIKGASQQQIIDEELQEENQVQFAEKAESELAKLEQDRDQSDDEPSVTAELSNYGDVKPCVESDVTEQSAMMKTANLSDELPMADVQVFNTESPEISPSLQQIEQSTVVPSEGKKALGDVVTNDGKEAILKTKQLGAVISAKHEYKWKQQLANTTIPSYNYMLIGSRSHNQRLSPRASISRRRTSSATDNESMTKIRGAGSMKSSYTTPSSSCWQRPISSLSDPATFTSLMDGLSDDEANKRFSDFIANRFALMKRESSESSR